MSIQAQTFPYRVVGIRRGETSTLDVDLEYENPRFQDSEDYRERYAKVRQDFTVSVST